MKHVTILSFALLISACHSTPQEPAPEELPAAAPPAPEEPAVEVSLAAQDARGLAERVRPFLEGRTVHVEALDAHTWLVEGAPDEVRWVRHLALAFDTPLLTPEHVALVVDIEHRDPRLLVNSARGRPDWGEAWIVAATAEPRWCAMIPQSEVAAFEAEVEQLDRPR